MKKNIIITGTSRGIGFELVKELAKKGHQILALSRNEKPIQNLNLPNVTTFPVDITQDKDIDKAHAFVQKKWKKVDVLIHNAGQIVKDSFEKINPENLKKVYEINVFGVFFLTQKLMSCFSEKSHIIAISSMGGIQGSVKFPELTAYSSSKAAVINLMEVLAEEYKETGPVFNALALGAVETEMFQEAFPEGQTDLKPKDMAQYISHFALNGHKVYNGKVLQVSNSTP